MNNLCTKILMVFFACILLGYYFSNQALAKSNKAYSKPLTKEQKTRIIFQTYEGGCFSAYLDRQYIMRCV